MDISQWQKKLLPFFVVFIIVVTIAFLFFYFYEMNNVHHALSEPPVLDTTTHARDTSFEEKKAGYLFKLESYALNNRYFHARLIIRTRILIISLSFLTGILLVVMGSVFTLGKFSEEQTSVEGGTEKAKLKFLSTSPGIIITTLGIVLISISILSKTGLNVIDNPLYINEGEFGVSDDRQHPAITQNPGLRKEYKIDSTKKEKADSMLRNLLK